MKTKTCASLTLLLLLALPARLFAADGDLVITDFNNNGELRWTHTATSGTYSVEWGSTAGGAWSRSWTQLVAIAATGTNYVVQVPMVYRVVFTPATNAAATETQTNEVIAVAQAGRSTYSGTLHTPVKPGSLTIDAGVFHLVDNGNGVLSGSGKTGLINYETGNWVIRLAGEWPPGGTEIVGHYTFGPATNDGTGQTQTNETIAVAVFGLSMYSGTISNTPVKPGSMMITAGKFVLVDNGAGALSGDEKIGTINYASGVWSIDLMGEWPAEGSMITAGYIFGP